MELGKDEAVQERVLEVARQFFANSNITVNLLPALIAGDCDVCVCLFLNYLNLFVQHCYVRWSPPVGHPPSPSFLPRSLWWRIHRCHWIRVKLFFF